MLNKTQIETIVEMVGYAVSDISTELNQRSRDGQPAADIEVLLDECFQDFTPEPPHTIRLCLSQINDMLAGRSMPADVRQLWNQIKDICTRGCNGNANRLINCQLSGNFFDACMALKPKYNPIIIHELYRYLSTIRQREDIGSSTVNYLLRLREAFLGLGQMDDHLYSSPNCSCVFIVRHGDDPLHLGRLSDNTIEVNELRQCLKFSSVSAIQSEEEYKRLQNQLNREKERALEQLRGVIEQNEQAIQELQGETQQRQGVIQNLEQAVAAKTREIEQKTSQLDLKIREMRAMVAKNEELVTNARAAERRRVIQEFEQHRQQLIRQHQEDKERAQRQTVANKDREIEQLRNAHQQEIHQLRCHLRQQPMPPIYQSAPLAPITPSILPSAPPMESDTSTASPRSWVPAHNPSVQRPLPRANSRPASTQMNVVTTSRGSEQRPQVQYQPVQATYSAVMPVQRPVAQGAVQTSPHVDIETELQYMEQQYQEVAQVMAREAAEKAKVETQRQSQAQLIQLRDSYESRVQQMQQSARQLRERFAAAEQAQRQLLAKSEQDIATLRREHDQQMLQRLAQASEAHTLQLAQLRQENETIITQLRDEFEQQATELSEARQTIADTDQHTTQRIQSMQAHLDNAHQGEIANLKSQHEQENNQLSLRYRQKHKELSQRYMTQYQEKKRQLESQHGEAIEQLEQALAAQRQQALSQLEQELRQQFSEQERGCELAHLQKLRQIQISSQMTLQQHSMRMRQDMEQSIYKNLFGKITTFTADIKCTGNYSGKMLNCLMRYYLQHYKHVHLCLDMTDYIAHPNMNEISCMTMRIKRMQERFYMLDDDITHIILPINIGMPDIARERSSNSPNTRICQMPGADEENLLYEIPVAMNGDCGFTCLGISRADLISSFRATLINQPDLIKASLSNEIENALMTRAISVSEQWESLCARRDAASDALREAIVDLKRTLPLASLCQQLEHHEFVQWYQLQQDKDEQQVLALIEKDSLLQELEQEIKAYCQQTDIIEQYIAEYDRGLYLGIDSALLYAKLNNIALSIWVEGQKGAAPTYQHVCELSEREVLMHYKPNIMHYDALGTLEQYNGTAQIACSAFNQSQWVLAGLCITPGTLTVERVTLFEPNSSRVSPVVYKSFRQVYPRATYVNEDEAFSSNSQFTGTWLLQKAICWALDTAFNQEEYNPKILAQEHYALYEALVEQPLEENEDFTLIDDVDSGANSTVVDQFATIIKQAIDEDDIDSLRRLLHPVDMHLRHQMAHTKALAYRLVKMKSRYELLKAGRVKQLQVIEAYLSQDEGERDINTLHEELLALESESQQLIGIYSFTNDDDVKQLSKALAHDYVHTNNADTLWASYSIEIDNKRKSLQSAIRLCMSEYQQHIQTIMRHMQSLKDTAEPQATLSPSNARLFALFNTLGYLPFEQLLLHNPIECNFKLTDNNTLLDYAIGQRRQRATNWLALQGGTCERFAGAKQAIACGDYLYLTLALECDSYDELEFSSLQQYFNEVAGIRIQYEALDLWLAEQVSIYNRYLNALSISTSSSDASMSVDKECFSLQALYEELVVKMHNIAKMYAAKFAQRHDVVIGLLDNRNAHTRLYSYRDGSQSDQNRLLVILDKFNMSPVTLQVDNFERALKALESQLLVVSEQLKLLKVSELISIERNREQTRRQQKYQALVSAAQFILKPAQDYDVSMKGKKSETDFATITAHHNRLPINSSDEQGNSLLHYACQYGQWHMVLQLLEHKVSITHNKYGETPFTIKMRNGNTVLHELIITGHWSLVYFILKRTLTSTPDEKALFEVKNAEGMTILETFSAEGNTLLHTVLAWWQQQYNSENHGNAGLRRQYFNLSMVLIDHGANMLSENDSGIMPLNIILAIKDTGAEHTKSLLIKRAVRYILDTVAAKKGACRVRWSELQLSTLRCLDEQMDALFAQQQNAYTQPGLFERLWGNSQQMREQSWHERLACLTQLQVEVLRSYHHGNERALVLAIQESNTLQESKEMEDLNRQLQLIIRQESSAMQQPGNTAELQEVNVKYEESQQRIARLRGLLAEKDKVIEDLRSSIQDKCEEARAKVIAEQSAELESQRVIKERLQARIEAMKKVIESLNSSNARTTSSDDEARTNSEESRTVRTMRG